MLRKNKIEEKFILSASKKEALYDREARYKKGEGKSYSWEEALKEIRNKNKGND